MTLRTNSRIAGVAFLVYIATGIGSMALAGRTNVTDVLSLVIKGVSAPVRRPVA